MCCAPHARMGTSGVKPVTQTVHPIVCHVHIACSSLAFFDSGTSGVESARDSLLRTTPVDQDRRLPRPYQDTMILNGPTSASVVALAAETKGLVHIFLSLPVWKLSCSVWSVIQCRCDQGLFDVETTDSRFDTVTPFKFCTCLKSPFLLVMGLHLAERRPTFRFASGWLQKILPDNRPPCNIQID